jgi:hypothetical protein
MPLPVHANLWRILHELREQVRAAAPVGFKPRFEVVAFQVEDIVDVYDEVVIPRQMRSGDGQGRRVIQQHDAHAHVQMSDEVDTKPIVNGADIAMPTTLDTYLLAGMLENGQSFLLISEENAWVDGGVVVADTALNLWKCGVPQKLKTFLPGLVAASRRGY